MTTISYELILEMIRQIVVQMKYDPGRSVNTFAVVDDAPDLFGASFGFTYEAYERDAFWSRTWVDGGAIRDQFCGEYPALFAEFDELGSPRDRKTDTRSITLSVILVDRIQCDTCPPYLTRSGPVVQMNMIEALDAILAEFSTYTLYEVREVGEETYFVWLTRGKKDFLSELYPGRTYVVRDEIRASLIDVSSVRKWGNYTELRGALATIRFSFCVTPKDWFSYEVSETVDRMASLSCPC